MRINYKSILVKNEKKNTKKENLKPMMNFIRQSYVHEMIEKKLIGYKIQIRLINQK